MFATWRYILWHLLPNRMDSKAGGNAASVCARASMGWPCYMVASRRSRNLIFRKRFELQFKRRASMETKKNPMIPAASGVYTYGSRLANLQIIWMTASGPTPAPNHFSWIEAISTKGNTTPYSRAVVLSSYVARNPSPVSTVRDENPPWYTIYTAV